MSLRHNSSINITDKYEVVKDLPELIDGPVEKWSLVLCRCKRFLEYFQTLNEIFFQIADVSFLIFALFAPILIVCNFKGKVIEFQQIFYDHDRRLLAIDLIVQVLRLLNVIWAVFKKKLLEIIVIVRESFLIERKRIGKELLNKTCKNHG